VTDVCILLTSSRAKVPPTRPSQRILFFPLWGDRSSVGPSPSSCAAPCGTDAPPPPALQVGALKHVDLTGLKNVTGESLVTVCEVTFPQLHYHPPTCPATVPKRGRRRLKKVS